jgi:6-phosphofructokinase 1
VVAAGAVCGFGTARFARAEEGEASNLRPHHLSSWRDGSTGLVSEKEVNEVTNPIAEKWPSFHFLNPEELVMGHIILFDSKAKIRAPELRPGCVRANACKYLWWQPEEVKVAIVTCGGLCPGLNSIIQAVTNTLQHDYNVTEIYGATSGWHGLSNPDDHPMVSLNSNQVRGIHAKGGSILKAGRGGFDEVKILDELQKKGINMVFAVGGEGTQTAAHRLFQAAKLRDQQLSIVGIPKSIDNDVLHIDKTFGFDSAVATASEILTNAWVEATSQEMGVGIVKLMGRDAGFVAMHAARAATSVDACLIPEVKFDIDDVLDHVDATLARKNHCVIAIAEGAGQEYVATGEMDATGHAKYGDVGVFLRDKVNAHLKERGGRSFYIDPSYLIRSVAIQPNDHIYCGRLGQDAVHTAMRGYTGVVVGPIHDIIVVLPAQLIARGKKRISLHSSAWQHVVQICKMPPSIAGLNQKEKIKVSSRT